MRFESRVFWVEKDAREPAQYQDAYAQDAERGLAAIADGVTAGIFSGAWARLLVEAVVAEPPRLEHEEFSQWLSVQRAAWRGAIDTSRLTWFQRPKMVDGGMTTLLWIELEPAPTDDSQEPSSYCGRSFAVGDSCLFHLRDGVLLACFPMANTADFGLNPSVLRSIDRQMDHLIEIQCREFICHPNDLLVLCTDAVALWAMTRYEAGETVDWASYWDVSEEAWREEIFSLRDTSAMRYDDSTLMLLRVAPRLAATIGTGGPAEEAKSMEAEAVPLSMPDAPVEPASNIDLSPKLIVEEAFVAAEASEQHCLTALNEAANESLQATLSELAKQPVADVASSVSCAVNSFSVANGDGEMRMPAAEAPGAANLMPDKVHGGSSESST